MLRNDWRVVNESRRKSASSPTMIHSPTHISYLIKAVQINLKLEPGNSAKTFRKWSTSQMDDDALVRRQQIPTWLFLLAVSCRPSISRCFVSRAEIIRTSTRWIRYSLVADFIIHTLMSIDYANLCKREEKKTTEKMSSKYLHSSDSIVVGLSELDECSRNLCQ